MQSANNVVSTSNNVEWWAGPDSNQRPSARQASRVTAKQLLSKFREFLRVHLRHSKKTAYEHTYYMRRFLNELSVSPEMVSSENVRSYLKSLEVSTAQYKNILMALKVFFRDFLMHPEVIKSFRFPHQVYKPKHIVSKEELRRFYKAIKTPKEKTLFLLYATSGLRRQDILSLIPEDLDFEKWMITPNSHFGETKKSWYSFYNEEAERALNEYLASKKHSRSKRIFPMQRYEVVELWKSAREKTGLDITPQKLRQWFCSEMLRLGVSETYVAAFCGRVHKSVLARHYTDFSPEKLLERYSESSLKVLS